MIFGPAQELSSLNEYVAYIKKYATLDKVHWIFLYTVKNVWQHKFTSSSSMVYNYYPLDE